MKNKNIFFFLSILAIVIVVIVIADFSSTRPGKTDNPYNFDVSTYREVDSGLIGYKEAKQIRIEADSLSGITYFDGAVYIVGDNFMRKITPNGIQLLNLILADKPRCIDVAGSDSIIIGFSNYVALLNSRGEIQKQSDRENKKSVFTSLAITEDNLIVADAGNRRILVYNREMIIESRFGGESGVSDKHGFIVPSPYFDIDVNTRGELWIVNPGMHALQNYTIDGKLRGYWTNSVNSIEGFCGCCNPAYFSFLPNGDFVTSEKKIVRIKVYKPSGEFKAVVAPPGKFTKNGHAPDICTDEKGNIIALDTDKKVIRFFVQKM